MAEECHRKDQPTGEQVAVETTDKGLFDFLGKKEKPSKPHCAEEEAISGAFEEKVIVSEPPHGVEYKEEEVKKFHRSNSSSSSSSEEEYEEEGVIKKRKKGLKEKIKDKFSGESKEEHKPEVDNSVPVEKCDDGPEEKKGFLEKIKEKIPAGGHKKAEEVPPPPPQAAAPAVEHHEGEAKKGFLDKIKEKLPGYHPKSEEEKEEKVKDGGCH